MQAIRLRGARTHNLKGIDLDLFAGQLVAVTGVSGAGKSSLAFDTLYSEGQRRFVESFSPYARQFLERLQRPPMDSLDPVAAGVAVDRRAPIKSSRSTVATMADVEAYLSALFACDARPRCPDCNVDAKYSDPVRAAKSLLQAHAGQRAIVTYRLATGGTEEFLDVREQLLRDGYRRVLIDDAVRDLDDTRPSDALALGGLDVVVDRIKLSTRAQRRLGAALEEGWSRGQERCALWLFADDNSAQRVPATRGLSCPKCGRSFAPPRSGMFSYQSPVGACGDCRGFGRVLGIDWHKVIPNPALSLEQRAIRPWSGRKSTWERRMLRQFCETHDIPLDVPWCDLDEAQREQIMEGEGVFRRRLYPGIRAWFRRLERKIYKMHVRVLLARYRSYDPCTACAGKRLSAASLMYRIDGLDLGDWHQLELRHARSRLAALEVSAGQARVAHGELLSRLGYLQHVGLGYLTLNRQARTLSGGEAQRVSLTAALGSSLTGALFVLDEPSVGLHATDLPPLVDAMRALAARGNAVLVVEHEPTLIMAADRIIELGPRAGCGGGEVVFDGQAHALPASSATARALQERPGPGAARKTRASKTRVPKSKARKTGPAQSKARKTSTDKNRAAIVIEGARANNLCGDAVRLLTGAINVVCGASGSGKSSLVHDVLYRASSHHSGQHDVGPPGQHDRLTGLDNISLVTLVDQSPLGRTSRGNAATYSGAWTRLRTLFAAQPEAQAAGFAPGHFSFNVAGGRCEACAGEGAETVEMQFLADVRLTCPACGGKRFGTEVLRVELDGLDVAQVLQLTVSETIERWAYESAVYRALTPLTELGLGYLTLGQPLSTLSGGEAQRLKLARALRDAGPGHLLLLDEPSAGLHADEVHLMLQVLQAQRAEGTTIVVVDHDLDVIAAAEWAVELGPGAGIDGGRVVFQGDSAAHRTADTRTGTLLAKRHAGQLRDTATRDPHTAKGVTANAAIEVVGAREHNLRGVDVAIPHRQLVVVTGPSGSGKSSLAFDVVFAEGQRRFLETLTPYARQFLPVMPRPDTDRVAGVPPSVALEQRTAHAGVNSTVATVTEIAHYLRLLYAKLGTLHCPDCDVPVHALAPRALFEQLRQRRGKYTLRASAVRARKGNHFDVFTGADRAGIEWAFADGKLVPTDAPPRLNKRKEKLG